MSRPRDKAIEHQRQRIAQGKSYHSRWPTKSVLEVSPFPFSVSGIEFTIAETPPEGETEVVGAVLDDYRVRLLWEQLGAWLKSEDTELTQILARFANDMKVRLDEGRNITERSWGDTDLETLGDSLMLIAGHTQHAVSTSSDYEFIAWKATDVACLAMMIADNARAVMEAEQKRIRERNQIGGER